ncbi:penicillin-binding transpeptidase domain-containing protein [Nonomuraea sp. N2-4H]
MRESGGRGQGPGRGAGGAGSQGGPGAARRTPGGPGRTTRQSGGSGRGGPSGEGRPPSQEPPRRRRDPDDPLDLPFGPEAFGPAGDARGRSRGDDRPAGRRRPRDDDDAGPRRAPRDDERPRGRAAQGRDDDGRPRGRAPRDEADRLRGRVQGRDDDRGRTARPGGAGRPGPAGRTGSAAGSKAAGQPGGKARRPGDEEPRGRGQDGPLRRTPSGAPRGAAGAPPGGPRGAAGARQDAARDRDGAAARRTPHSGSRGASRGGDVPPPRGPRRPPPRPPLVLRLGNPRRRINIGLIGMTFVLSIFAGRLIQMQGLDAKVYEAAAAEQRVQTVAIPAKRGSITDVKGHYLAVTREARDLSIDPTKVPSGKRAEVASVLAQQLGKSEQEIAAKLARTDTRYQLLARGVDPFVATRLLQAKIPSLAAKKTYRRDYPAGDLAGSLIGFVGDDGTGLGGIEREKNELLAGRDGKMRVETGRDGQQIPMTSSEQTPPVDGRDVRLTIDRDIQWAAQKSIADQVKKSGADSGTVIVMDVQTAQIIAMANAPELDLNNWRKAPESSFVNKAASVVFEPGSTNKVITAAAALEAKVVTPDTVYRVPDRIKCADQVLRDAHSHKTEPMTFRQAMAQSSNVATVMAARKVGSERLHAMLKAFGFGSRPGGGVPGARPACCPTTRSGPAARTARSPTGRASR